MNELQNNAIPSRLRRGLLAPGASVLPVPTNDIRVVIIGNVLYALGGENIEPATSNTTPWLRIGRIRTSEK